MKIKIATSSHKVKGQGVNTACDEHYNLLKENKKYIVGFNEWGTYDIVHYHTVDPTFYIQSKMLKKTKKVASVHFLPETLEGSLKIPKIITPMIHKYVVDFYKSMDCLIVVNSSFKSKLIELGIEASKIHYMPNFVSQDVFYEMKREEKKQVREELGIKKDQFVVLSVGQVQERKGVFDFIEVAKQMPDYTFIWAGGFSFKGLTAGYEKLKKIMQSPPKNVIFTGIVERDEMNRLYNISDVYFMPSYNELFPMAILEAMAVKKPIVLRDLDLYKEILGGYYIPCQNNEAFKKQLIKLKEHELYYHTAVNNAHKGSVFYSKENVAKMWDQFYEQLMGKNKEIKREA